MARRIAVAAVVVLLLAGLGGLWLSRSRVSQPGSGPELAQLSISAHFTLVDQSGQTVTPASYRGRWLLVYFGYTTCPDVCPTTLQMISRALAALGTRASQVVPLFITVDPARDTPQVLAGYTSLFDKRIVGLTGSQTQVTAAEQAFRVYAAKVPQPGGSYLMDHTSFIYLIDPDGHLRALFGSDATAATLAARLHAVLA